LIVKDRAINDWIVLEVKQLLKKAMYTISLAPFLACSLLYAYITEEIWTRSLASLDGNCNYTKDNNDNNDVS